MAERRADKWLNKSQSRPPLVLVCYLGSEVLPSCALPLGHVARLLVPYLEQWRYFNSLFHNRAEYNKCPAERLKQNNVARSLAGVLVCLPSSRRYLCLHLHLYLHLHLHLQPQVELSGYPTWDRRDGVIALIWSLCIRLTSYLQRGLV